MTRKTLLRHALLLFLVAGVVVVQWFSANPARVERWYSQGFYPPFSRGLRAVFGWIPVSLGDLLYLAAGLFLALRVFRILHWVWKRELREHLHWRAVRRTAKVILGVYLVFQVFWGLNYSRQDIATQLRLNLQPSDTALLPALANLLQERLCTWGDKVDSVRRLRLQNRQVLFEGATAAYAATAPQLPFLNYQSASIKPSLYTPFGHFFGFTGYYNPFTGEAQLHTGIPVFLKPFVVCHEMGHQLGWARENEANFAGFLAARNAPDADFAYSAYYEMYIYTIRALAGMDRGEAFVLRHTMHPQVRRDYQAYLRYLYHTKNAMEPVVMKFYDGYLKLNNQRHGIETYDEVVLWLLGYYKKYGSL